MIDATLGLGMVITFIAMSLGIRRWGVGGGFAGFFVGAILTGLLATQIGVDLGGDGCTRYSNYPDDC